VADDPEHFHRHIAQIRDEDLLSALNGDARSLAAWAEYWDAQKQRAPFRDIDDLLVSREQAAESLALDRENILLAAERILRHDIQGWGDISIQHGKTVDFNADYGRNGKYGFHYWFWAKPLIQAFLLTGLQQYLAKFDGLFNSWYEQREQIRGDIDALDVIYYELGLGLRVRTFLEYYGLPFAERSLQTHMRMLKTLLGAGRWLYECERPGYRSGNWQIMGCAGLAWIASLLPEFSESPAWTSMATERLNEHVQRDLYKDGCHWERVPSSYMLTVYKDIHNVATLTQRSDLISATDRMLKWYMQTLPPDGVIPGINDGSRVCMPARLLREARHKFPEVGHHSINLPESGFTVLRDSKPSGLHMLINHGPIAGGHTHNDALAFELHAGANALAIDSGIGKTYDDPLHESWYTTPAAHNMLEVVGANLDRATAEGSEVVFVHSPALDYFAATHHGYEYSAGVVHRRHILFVRQGYFLIIDQIHATSAVDLVWHLHSPLSIARNTEPLSLPFVFRAREKDGEHIPTLGVSWDQPVWTAQNSHAMASVSGILGYSDYEKITWLKLSHSLSPGSTKIAVLLYPGTNAQLIRAGDGYWTIEHANGQDHFLLPAHEEKIDNSELSFQGLCAMWRLSENQVTQWAVLNATQLRVGKQTLWQSQSPAHANGDSK
jgi:Heparinase II/III-like protein/Heparinase II/III N-terminus